MKDMDILYPLVSYDYFLVKRLGHSEPAKLDGFGGFQDSFLWQIFSVKPFFLKSHHLKMKLLRDLKPKPADHQYPKFSPCGRITLISQSTLDVFKFQLWTLVANVKKGVRCLYRRGPWSKVKIRFQDVIMM